LGAGEARAPDGSGGFRMTSDFTLEKYSELVQALKENYRIMGVADYISLPRDEGSGEKRTDIRGL